jgi:hypothetical protein
VSCSDPTYAAIYSRHYTGSKGQIGRQLHYLLWHAGRVLGIAAAGEAMFRSRARDRFFGLTYARVEDPPPPWLVACVVLRLEEAPHGLASQVIALWRAAVASDWPCAVRGFETLVGLPRSGCCFRHDGWKKIGYTRGLGARRPDGHGHTRRIVVRTEHKMILARWA